MTVRGVVCGVERGVVRGVVRGVMLSGAVGPRRRAGLMLRGAVPRTVESRALGPGAGDGMGNCTCGVWYSGIAGDSGVAGAWGWGERRTMASRRDRLWVHVSAARDQGASFGGGDGVGVGTSFSWSSSDCARGTRRRLSKPKVPKELVLESESSEKRD